MRIVQIVTLVSPDGEYGGPLRVALNQAAALREAGHDVVLAAAARGFAGTLPAEYDGVPVRLFPARTALPGSGFAGLSAPGMLPWLAREARSADVVHIHLARDLVGVPAALLLRALGRPFVVQTHGMIDPSEKRLAALLDAVAVRGILRASRRVLALTPHEQGLIAEVEPRARMTILPNGIPLDPARPVADPASARDVLYLARVAPRKRPLDFLRAAELLAHRCPEWTFSMVGPDEGSGTEVQDFLARRPELAQRVTWEGVLPPSETAARLARSAIYVLPAENEPFPMSVIEAMHAGLPVVLRPDNGLSPYVERHSAGVVYDRSVEGLVTALAQLMESPASREEAGRRASAAVEEELGIGAVASRLAEIYEASAG